MRIVVVGVGALGSHLVVLGRNLPVEWVVVDDDRVERKNVLSQFHTRMGLGRNKAQALQQAMQGLFEVRVQAVPHRLVADNVEALLGQADLVVDCVDNAPTRTLIQRFVRERGLACLHGALAADGAYGRVMWDAQFTIDAAGAGEEAATCEDGEHLAFIVRAAALMAQAVQRFVKDGTRSAWHLNPDGVQVL